MSLERAPPLPCLGELEAAPRGVDRVGAACPLPSRTSARRSALGRLEPAVERRERLRPGRSSAGSSRGASASAAS